MNVERNIPFFNYPALFAEREKQFMEVIHDVLKRGAYIMQKDLSEFEKSLSQYLGVKHAIGTADGTMALILGLMASGIEPGDEVIVPSHTFVASAAAIHHVGAVPVLADCGPDHLIDSNSVKALISSRTRAIMPVQLNGRTADMDTLFSIADPNGLVIIEDSCQALGSKFKGRFAGTFGRAGAFSFYPSKTLGCFGDGGALVTNEDSVAEKALMLRDHGRGPDGKVWCFGFNARLDNIQAAILNLKLKHLVCWNQQRRRAATLYRQHLADIKEISLPREMDYAHHVYHLFVIEALRRNQLQKYLAKKEVTTIIHYPTPIHMQKPYRQLGYKKGDFPITEA